MIYYIIVNSLASDQNDQYNLALNTKKADQCKTGAVIIDGVCKCDESQGYAGANGYAESCIYCWNIGISAFGFCIACPSFTKREMNTCVCDDKQGFAGPDFEHCKKCWDYDQVVISGNCVSCSNGAIFQTDKCYCDSTIGLISTNTASCSDCWQNSQIIHNSQCNRCEDVDANSVYDSQGICKCVPPFTLKNNICIKTEQNSKIVIAICVPIGIVLLLILLVIFVIKNKKQRRSTLVEPQVIIASSNDNNSNSKDEIILPELTKENMEAERIE
ncbi:Growth_factor receptor cysteine-rich domain superfamily [Hexamita inflata]|uniref:Growth factor receptor cysteine-rich domain superfamily n=1 Tax=Hexamita inflata TaxID=28002 RepID=A0AA86USR9_9EUKA|nr:Growth factor receptor cysteine-rich domain superfamily [Hexamita inflata]